MELKSGEQAFIVTRPRLTQAGYTTLESIPLIKKGSGTKEPKKKYPSGFSFFTNTRPTSKH